MEKHEAFVVRAIMHRFDIDNFSLEMHEYLAANPGYHYIADLAAELNRGVPYVMKAKKGLLDLGVIDQADGEHSVEGTRGRKPVCLKAKTRKSLRKQIERKAKAIAADLKL